MTVSFMTLFYSMVNGKKYNSYTIYDLYIVIIGAYFCPLQDKNTSKIFMPTRSSNLTT